MTKSSFLPVLPVYNNFKWQYMAEAGAGAEAGAEIMDKGGSGAEMK